MKGLRDAPYEIEAIACGINIGINRTQIVHFSS